MPEYQSLDGHKVYLILADVFVLMTNADWHLSSQSRRLL
jgi:hypothetical protein